MTPSELRRISVISPCRNERDYIAPFVESLLAQELPAGYALEVLIADGMSDDGTREILDAFAQRHPRLKVVANPGRIVSPGLNAAIRASSGDVIVRMDAHTVYAPDYVRRCVETLERTGADNVGGPWRAAGDGYLQEAIALVSHSPFASGGGRSHALDYEGEVDTVYLGCWRRAIFDRVGLFDEELVRNQDDELNLRIVRAGGRVWQSPAIRSSYAPRSSLANLFSQYKQYGYWKVRVIQKHTLPASIRHVVPGAFVFGLLALALLSLLWTPARGLLALALSAYLAANLLATLHTCMTAGTFRYLPVMPIVFAGYHFGYGYGFLRGVVDFVLLRRGTGAAFTSITRGSSSGTADELSAVAQRYDRRKAEVGADRYDPTNSAVSMAHQERERALIRWVQTSGLTPVRDKTLLEVGCGSGSNLLQLILLGFRPANLLGNELLEERAAQARERLPGATRIAVGDASSLDLGTERFDVVFQSTVFSSILDGEFQSRLARRMWALTKPGGQVLWYDFTYDNPRNPDVRGVPVARIRALFPEGTLSVRRLTLAPPIARPLARIHPSLYTLANLLPLLRTHVLCSIRKPRD